MGKVLKFPPGFLWGAATSSHQAEGNNFFNDWWEWELESAESKVKAAKLKQWPDYILSSYPSPFDKQNYISGKACDHYNLFEEDFDLAKSLNQNVHRFSIEWARVEPEEGRFNEDEIEHYRRVVSALRQRQIEPFPTLWHFTLPQWFAKKGGWLQKEALKYFIRYVQKIVQALGKEVHFWLTMNEPMIYVNAAFREGRWPPQEKSFFKSWRIARQLIKAHKLSYKAAHKINDNFQIGIANYMTFLEGSVLVPILKYFPNDYFLHRIKGYQDFIGLNYYRFRQLSFAKKKLWTTDLGWEIYPEGVYCLLKDLKRYKLPIYITENGLADAQDKKRMRFILDHLYHIWRAIQEGVDVRGYFYWSLLDNFEWAYGFWPRFGLVEVDYETLKRKIRPSAKIYAEIAKRNQVSTNLSKPGFNRP